MPIRPVRGLNAKLIAAFDAGIRKVYLPLSNDHYAENDVANEVRNQTV